MRCCSREEGHPGDCGSEYFPTYTELFAFMALVTDQNDAALCPFCGDRWDCERDQDLCFCQFAKRRPAGYYEQMIADVKPMVQTSGPQCIKCGAFTTYARVKLHGLCMKCQTAKRVGYEIQN